MVYKNVSNKKLTFYGVTAEPGQLFTVPGYVNHRKVIPADGIEFPKSSKHKSKVKVTAQPDVVEESLVQEESLEQAKEEPSVTE